MSATCDTSLGWIYKELMNKIKILEQLSEAEFSCAYFDVNLYFSISALTGQCPKHFEDFIVRIRAKN